MGQEGSASQTSRHNICYRWYLPSALCLGGNGHPIKQQNLLRPLQKHRALLQDWGGD